MQASERETESDVSLSTPETKSIERETENDVSLSTLERKEKMLEKRLNILMQCLEEEIEDQLEPSLVGSLYAPLAPAANPIAGGTCGICLDQCEEPTASLCGRHVYCQHCITTWHQDHSSCPECRFNTRNLFDRVKALCEEGVTYCRKRMREVIAEVDNTLHLEEDPYDTERRIDMWFRRWNDYFILGLERCLAGMPCQSDVYWVSKSMRFLSGEGKRVCHRSCLF